MAIEAGDAFILIRVDLDDPNAPPEVEVNGMSVWAASLLLHVAATDLDNELPTASAFSVNRQTGMEVLVCKDPCDDDEDNDDGE